MAVRKIISIDADKCNGCSLCIPNCPEGAIQIIDDKARLVSDLFCDGLGACLGHCPQKAISVEEREAEPYDERQVMTSIIKQGPNVIKAHLHHLKEHAQDGYLKEAIGFLKEKNINIAMEGSYGDVRDSSGCPGSKMMDFRKRPHQKRRSNINIDSELTQWPVQLYLVPTQAPYFDGADILVAADCVPFAYANFHQGLLKGKVLLVGCPKLDDVSFYKDKLKQIFKDNNIKSVNCVHMEVHCCFGLLSVIKDAIDSSNKKIPFKDITISIKGENI
jgi:ferredoxin